MKKIIGTLAAATLIALGIGWLAHADVTQIPIAPTGNWFVPAANGIGWTGLSQLQSPSDGIITLYNNAANGFTRLQFGGTTSAARALAPGSGNLAVIAADGSSFQAIQASELQTGANCSSAAAPAVCGSAAAGSVVVAAAATTVVVNTTIVTANSQVLLTFDSSLGSKLSATCNTTYVNSWVSARTAATSFTVTVASAPAANPACFSYQIVN